MLIDHPAHAQLAAALAATRQASTLADHLAAREYLFEALVYIMESEAVFWEA